jgi:hypothetical protein
MRLPIVLAVLVSLPLGLPGRAAAWHRDGHYAIARIAWKQLDPGLQLAIDKLLKAHPHYEVYLADERPRKLISEMEWTFVRAATWADWVRNPQGPGLDGASKQAIRTEYNKPVWHYVDLPFIHPNDVDNYDPATIRKEILFPAFDAKGEPRHALAAIDLAVKQLRTPGTTAATQAVALCWLSHVIGDLHQPLHGTSLIASANTYDPPLEPPGGDLGGNRVAIKPKADSASAVNLHFYWDALVFAEEPGIVGVDGVVARLLSDPKLKRDALPELDATDPLAWAEESRAAAEAWVYRGKSGFLRLRTLPAKSKVSLKTLDSPVLPAGYAEAAQEVAARRMVLAGYRLADRLKQAVRAGKPS